MARKKRLGEELTDVVGRQNIKERIATSDAILIEAHPFNLSA
jgi:hypothetical protein